MNKTYVFLMKSKQKQPSRGVLRKRCSGNLQQIYWRTPMSKCDFNKVASNFIEIILRHRYSPVDLLHIFRTPFPKNTSGGLLLSKLSISTPTRKCSSVFYPFLSLVNEDNKCGQRLTTSPYIWD